VEPFADDAVIRRVAAEGVIVAVGGRAILLQIAHPKVAAGVAEHSDFQQAPLSRLRGTLWYMLGTVYGDRREMHDVADVVKGVHRRIVGPGYSANDPDLQVWVGATLYESTVILYERVMGSLSAAQRGELLREYGVLATALGCPAEKWPADLETFSAYWDGMIATLQVSDQARDIARDVLYPAKIPIALRPLIPVHRLVSVGLLPARIRDGFGLSWPPARRRALDVGLAMLRRTYPHVPAAVRHRGVAIYLHDLRRRRAADAKGRRPPGGGAAPCRPT
jgi:uncharacterized protein (DUF2236 family)